MWRFFIAQSFPLLDLLADNVCSDTRWYLDFVNRAVRTTRKSTLSMIVTLDFRGFRTALVSVNVSGLHSYLASSLQKLSGQLPNLRCIVFDGHTDLDPAFLVVYPGRHFNLSFQNLTLLSMADCQTALPRMFFHGCGLSNLVYLDVSRNRGWARGILVDSKTFTPLNLPNLRVLKLRGLGIDSFALAKVLEQFSYQLWSLDLSSNRLAEDFMNVLMTYSVRCEKNSRLQTDDHFEVEGKLRAADPLSFAYFVDESTSSATFSHPERYLADSPVYSAESIDHTNSVVRPGDRVRLTGTELVRGDSTDEIARVLDGGPYDAVPDAPHISNHAPALGGLTHIHLNDLEFPPRVIERLLAFNSGYVEHLECNVARLLTDGDERKEWLLKMPWLSRGTEVYGFPGISYLLRPVFSSNLRVLKIHHSLVTNVPTIATTSVSTPESIWLAETCLRERFDLAFPLTYIPDMNPRLYSLTLCRIPRYSAGVVTERLVNFLKLAAAQERGTAQMRRAIAHHRGPTVVRGLRHIRLEFDADVKDELLGLDSDNDIVDAVEEFSFFSESAWDASPSSIADRSREASATSAISSSTDAGPTVATPALATPNGGEAPPYDHRKGERLQTSPYDRTETEYCEHPLDDGRTLPVWIGSGILGPETSPAVNEYMRILALSGGLNAQSPMPATPCHVVAGVPVGAFIFRQAWDRILIPAEAVQRPTAAELRDMRDVLEEIKAFRLASRGEYAALVKGGNQTEQVGQHAYWKGRLEIELARAKEDLAEYWRR